MRFKLTDVDMLIVDNSDSLEIIDENIQYCQKNGHMLLTMRLNAGLSKAYNAAIDYIFAKKIYDFIILLDDDTDITKEYFDILNELILEYPQTDIFAPIIYGQDRKIYSPNEAFILKNKLMKNENSHVSMDRFNAINSCLAIKLDVYNNYRYDERLFLDQVDQKFFDDARKRKLKFHIIPASIEQNFSQRNNKATSEVIWNRFKLRIRDMASYSRLYDGWYYLGLIKSLGWAVQMALKCKSIKLFFKMSTYSIQCFFMYS